MKQYDIIVVGAGAAGVFMSYEMAKLGINASVLVLDKGGRLEERVCPIKKGVTRTCVKCNPCHIMNGYGGAGTLSDGKYNITTQFGGDLHQYVGIDYAMELMEYVDRVLCNMGGEDAKLYSTASSKLKTDCLKHDLHLLEAKVRHLGTDRNVRILGKMFDYSKDKIDMQFHTTIAEVRKQDDGTFVVVTDKGDEFSCKDLVLATGRSGSKWISTVCDKFGVELKKNRVDIGVRVVTVPFISKCSDSWRTDMGRGKDNIRYREMEVAEGTYIPDCDVCYPEQDPDEHIMPVRYDGTEVVLDENYPYLDDSFRYRFNHFLNATLLRLLVMHVNRLRYGLKVEGREKLRRNKALLRNGAITVCNHVYRWDLSCVLHAIRPHRTWFPIYGEHLRGKDAWFMRYLGGVPVPETRSGMRPFNEAFDELHRRGEWIHVFPESCSWKHYVPIRPFHKGAFTMAYKYGMPLVPFVISYRERKGIFRWFDKADTPLMTVHVGDAIIPDLSRPRKEEVDRMLREAHAQMVTMAGIVKNPWPATLEP